MITKGGKVKLSFKSEVRMDGFDIDCNVIAEVTEPDGDTFNGSCSFAVLIDGVDCSDLITHRDRERIDEQVWQNWRNTLRD